MNKLMVDCETLDVGECPVILSIGAVVFNDSELVASFSAKISTASCELIGCTTSEETKKWWEQQSEEARSSAFGGTREINEVMLNLIRFYEGYECHEIWSRGSLADIRWINNILDKLEIDKPWKYYQEMCFRTLLKMAPDLIPGFSGTPHNALDDAINQAKQLIYIKQHYIKQAQAIKEMGQLIANLEFTLLKGIPPLTTANPNSDETKFLDQARTAERWVS